MFATKSAPALGLALNIPSRWLVLDIETGDANEESILSALGAWKPPSNIKDPDKVEARRLEAMEKIRERAALLDASPILCIAVQTDRTAIVVNGMDKAQHQICGWRYLAAGNERDMLIAIGSWLDLNTDQDTVIVGHNIRNFDLPKLRNAYLRHRLRLPSILVPRIIDGDQVSSVVDTASLFKAFSMEHRDDFCPSLETMAASMGITRPKGVISGADVPRLHREGRYAEICTYCCIDTACTASAYLLMSGQYEGQ